MLLKDKVIIISGVGPGMGQAMAKIAASEGAKVGLGARNQDFLDKVLAEIKSKGGEAVALSTDVTQSGQCAALAKAVADKFGQIDGLVNSAYNHGAWATADVANPEEWAAVYDVNCLGALRMSQAVLPMMKAQKSGAIVNVSTPHGLDRRRASDGLYRRPSRRRTPQGRGCRRDYGPYSARYNSARR